MHFCLTVVLVTVFLCSGSSGIVFADDQLGPRIIEESLLVQDPTIARPKHLTVGGNIEYWYVTQDYDTPGNAAASGSLAGSMPGGSFFIGYDDLTFQVSYRDGSWDAKQHITSYNVDYNKNLKDKELELAFRYVFYKSRWFNPYALLGYNYKEIRVRSELTTPKAVWDIVMSPVIGGVSYHNSILTGLGNITPINKWVGVRTDFRMMIDDYRFSDDIGTKRSNWGTWYRATLTGYLNIFEGINFQTGFRYDLLPGSVNNGDSRDKLGYFASLGYAYKF